MPYMLPASYELPFHSGSDTSRDAAIRAQQFVGPQGETVLAWFRTRGRQGGTQKEAAAALDMERSSIAARVHALEKAGQLLKWTGRRDGCAIYTAA